MGYRLMIAPTSVLKGDRESAVCPGVPHRKERLVSDRDPSLCPRAFRLQVWQHTDMPLHADVYRSLQRVGNIKGNDIFAHPVSYQHLVRSLKVTVTVPSFDFNSRFLTRVDLLFQSSFFSGDLGAAASRIFSMCLRLFHLGFVDLGDQFFQVARLHQIIKGAQFHALNCRFESLRAR